MRITLDFAGENQLDRELARVKGRVEDASPAFDIMADYAARELLKNFTTQGGHASGRWAPLSPRYARWKAKRYPGAPILVRTGAMRRELTRRPFGVEKIGPRSMTIGTARTYAPPHQTGNPAKNLPRRRPFEFTDTARKHLAKILQRFVMTGRP
jgi:phage gpG-like protein